MVAPWNHIKRFIGAACILDKRFVTPHGRASVRIAMQAVNWQSEIFVSGFQTVHGPLHLPGSLDRDVCVAYEWIRHDGLPNLHTLHVVNNSRGEQTKAKRSFNSPGVHGTWIACSLWLYHNKQGAT